MTTLIAALDTFRAGTTAETVTVRGRQWKIIDSGSKGPVLLMLPGTLGNADIFFKQIQKLGKRIRIIALSSPLIADVDVIAGDIAALLDRLDIPSASILGSSFGGFLAQTFAELYPARVETLFIGNSLNNHKLMGSSLPPPDVLLKAAPKALRVQISSQMKAWDIPEKIFAEVRDLLLRELAHHLPPRGPKLRLAAIFLRKNAPVPAVPDSQIVIIDSEDDPLISAPVRDDVCARHPKAEHHRLPSGGHFPYLTRSTAYNDIITNRLGV